MDGFRRPRPRRPEAQSPVVTPATAALTSTGSRAQSPQSAPEADRSASQPANELVVKHRQTAVRRRRWPWVMLSIVMVLLAAGAGAYWWYSEQLRPVSDDAAKRSLMIANGDSVATIAQKLKAAGLIRHELAFQLHLRLSGNTKLQAGSCRLSPSQSTPEITAKIAAGCRDFKVLTFYPGGTLEPSQYKASRAADGVDKSSARYVLRRAGYSDQDITEAFRARYDSPLFAGKPADAPLEGYIFGETYYVAADATAKQALEAVFAQMYTVVKKHDLEEKYRQQGLTLYQGIIMASIIERELTCEDKPTLERKERCYQYQRGIAQVFLKRHTIGMRLGSDSTAVYAADHKGIAIPKDDTATLLAVDSPYNTRKYAGLTPTPIGAPGELALKAVAMPTPTDYLFFLAGDDGLIYFARTDQEHQANTKQHCQVLCKKI